MPHSKRKLRKQRGSRTHGYGIVGQHRGGGQRGGHGKAGRKKGKWTYVVKYEPDYFGKHGFKSPREIEKNAINVSELDERINELLKEKKVVKRRNGIHVDLHKLGYDKLLGKGDVTHPLIISVASCSKSAAEKVERAKGKIAIESR